MADPTVDDKKIKIREGPFRSYDVSSREVLNGTKKLLMAAGYKFLPNDAIGFMKPTFRAVREWQGRRNEIVAVVRPDIRKAVDGFVHLTAAHSVLGDKVEYALVLPPINEWVLLRFLDDDDSRMDREIRARKFMLWMYTPSEDAVMSFRGGSSDPLFRGSMLLPGFFSRRMLEKMAEMEAKRAQQAKK